MGVVQQRKTWLLYKISKDKKKREKELNKKNNSLCFDLGIGKVHISDRAFIGFRCRNALYKKGTLTFFVALHFIWNDWRIFTENSCGW